MNRATAAPASSGTRAIKVWDVPVRAFHWALVALVVASVATGTLGGNAMTWHMWSGYAILALVLFRVIWGVVGSHHARFAGFVHGPQPGSVEASRDATRTEEVAVMIDTFAPLAVSDAARAISDPDYPWTWAR